MMTRMGWDPGSRETDEKGLSLEMLYIIFANGDDSSPTIEVRDAPLKKSHQRSYDKVGEKMRESKRGKRKRCWFYMNESGLLYCLDDQIYR